MPDNQLTPKEVLIIQMALATTIEDVEGGLKNPTYPFTPQARKEMKEMLEHAKSAKAKIDKVVGHEIKLDPYKDGDEKDFVTKQS